MFDDDDGGKNIGIPGKDTREACYCCFCFGGARLVKGRWRNAGNLVSCKKIRGKNFDHKNWEKNLTKS